MTDQPQRLNTSVGDTIIYVLCFLTAVATAYHLSVIGNWPGWKVEPHPSLWAYVIQFIPVFALLACGIAALITRRGYGDQAIWIVAVVFVPTILVAFLDLLTGSLGMVD